MTREEFIKVLDEKRYSYEIVGDNIVVTRTLNGDAWLDSLKTLPPSVMFENRGSIFLSLKTLPPGVEFKNGGYVELNSLTTLLPGVEFKNGGDVSLNSLETLPPGVEFKNGGDVVLRSLQTISPGVEFNNQDDVWLEPLIGGRFVRFSKWEGNIDGIDSKRLLNLMISKGMFI